MPDVGADVILEFFDVSVALTVGEWEVEVEGVVVAVGDVGGVLGVGCAVEEVDDGPDVQADVEEGGQGAYHEGDQENFPTSPSISFPEQALDLRFKLLPVETIFTFPSLFLTHCDPSQDPDPCRS